MVDVQIKVPFTLWGTGCSHAHIKHPHTLFLCVNDRSRKALQWHTHNANVLLEVRALGDVLQHEPILLTCLLAADMLYSC
jgi:hypothetical protein